jgi:hypothetical protein
MGALGRTRTCDLLIRSHSHSGTGTDMEGQGETKPRFYRESGFLKRHRGTGRDTQLRSDCGQKLCKKPSHKYSGYYQGPAFKQVSASKG